MTIEVADVSKWFGSIVALSEVTCRVEPGITALLGPNGAGKSTLLRVICGLTAPSRGEVRILGMVPRRSARPGRESSAAASPGTTSRRVEPDGTNAPLLTGRAAR